MRRIALALAVVLAVSGGACTTVPAPIITPVPTRSTVVAPTFSVALARATATIQRPDGTTETITGNGENSLGGSYDTADAVLSLLMPALLSLHSADPAGDVGAFVGWRQVGLSGRQRFYESRGGFLLSLAGAAKGSWVGGAGDLSAALDFMTPEVDGVRGIVRLGLSYGRREYDVEVPHDLDPTYGHDNTVGNAHLVLHRVDARLETVAGLALGHGHAVVSMQPYWVIWHGAAGDAHCDSCVSGVGLLGFSLDRGLAVAITFR